MAGYPWQPGSPMRAMLLEGAGGEKREKKERGEVGLSGCLSHPFLAAASGEGRAAVPDPQGVNY